jgi:hypothetical protein
MSTPSDFGTPKHYEALQVPPAAVDRGGLEILRCAVIDDGLHVTLRPVFDDTRMWGRVLADVARQLAHAYAHQERGTVADVIASIRFAFENDLNVPPEAHSEIGPLS